MNNLSIDRKALLTSSARTALLTLSLLLLAIGITAKQVPAQSTQQSNVAKVAITDFGILPRAQTNTIQERDAAMIVFHALESSGLYAMIPQATVDEQRVRYHFKKSLDTTAIRRLGKYLDADLVASCAIVDVRFQENPRRARVTLSVRLMHVVTGELANGAIETGTSLPAAPGYSDKAMLQDALRNATSYMISAIKSYTPTTGTILQVQTGKQHHKTLILNPDPNTQFESGLKMIVYRGSTRIGHIRVTEVRSGKVVARAIDQRADFRPGDKVWPVFELVVYETTGGSAITYSSSRGIGDKACRSLRTH